MGSQSHGQPFRLGSIWTTATADHWFTTTTKTRSAGVTLRVHFNVLTGELLVNGLPLDRLRHKYENHQSYRTLFGHSAIEVMPTVVPGMDFAAKRDFSGYEIQFGMSTRADQDVNDLLVEASKKGKRYELLSPNLFRDVFPAAFIGEYIHWFNLEDGGVEFRPIDVPWGELCPRTWVLVPDQATALWRLTKDAASQVLFGVTCATSQALALTLSPFADPYRIHITSQPSRHSVSQLLLLPKSLGAPPGIMQPSLREVEVNTPGLRLGFALNAGQSSLRCKEIPKMSIVSN